MSEIKRLVGQMDNAFYGEAWHGPAVMELLAELSAENASQAPVLNAHSILEITNHICVWKKIAAIRLGGTPKQIEIGSADDWPPTLEPTDENWNRTLEDLKLAHEKLKEVVAGLNDIQLAEDAPYNKTTDYNYTLIQGVIQHDLYHAGQIALIRKSFA